MSYYYIDYIYDYTIFHPMSKTCCTAILWLGWYFSPKTMICTAAPKRAGKWSKHWKSNKPTNDGIKNITTCQNNFPGDPARNCDLEKRDSILSYAVDSSSQPGHPPLQAHSQSPPGDRRPTSGLWGFTSESWQLAILGVLFWDLHGFTMSRSMSRSGFPWFSTCPFYLLRI